MKATNNLMVRIGEGLIGWFTFQQAAHRSGIYSEYLFYPPIFELAAGRKWRVSSQIPLSENKKSTYDMAFVKMEKSAAAALEVKFVRNKKRSYKNGIINDLNKLHLIRTNPSNYLSNIVPEVYELIVGKEEAIKKAIKDTPLNSQWDDQWTEGDKKLGKNSGWRFCGGGQESFAYTIAIFRYDKCWWTDPDPDLLVDDGPEFSGAFEPINDRDDVD